MAAMHALEQEFLQTLDLFENVSSTKFPSISIQFKPQNDEIRYILSKKILLRKYFNLVKYAAHGYFFFEIGPTSKKSLATPASQLFKTINNDVNKN